MKLVFIILIVTSISLYLLSFLKKDRLKALENQVETLSLTMMQDQYQVNKKIGLLQEELLMDHSSIPVAAAKKEQPKAVEHPLVQKQIVELIQNGVSPSEIATTLSLSIQDILVTVEKYKRGRTE